MRIEFWTGVDAAKFCSVIVKENAPPLVLPLFAHRRFRLTNIRVDFYIQRPMMSADGARASPCSLLSLSLWPFHDI